MSYHLHSPVSPAMLSTNLNIEILSGIIKNKIAYRSITKTGNSEFFHCCWRTQTKRCSSTSISLSEFLIERIALGGVTVISKRDVFVEVLTDEPLLG